MLPVQQDSTLCPSLSLPLSSVSPSLNSEARDKRLERGTGCRIQTDPAPIPVERAQAGRAERRRTKCTRRGGRSVQSGAGNRRHSLAPLPGPPPPRPCRALPRPPLRRPARGSLQARPLGRRPSSGLDLPRRGGAPSQPRRRPGGPAPRGAARAAGLQLPACRARRRLRGAAAGGLFSAEEERRGGRQRVRVQSSAAAARAHDSHMPCGLLHLCAQPAGGRCQNGDRQLLWIHPQRGGGGGGRGPVQPAASFGCSLLSSNYSC